MESKAHLLLSFSIFFSQLSLGFSSCETECDITFSVQNKTTTDGYFLEGFLLDNIQVSNEKQCFSACIERDCKCMSFNFNSTADNNDHLHECQLNYEDKKTVPSALKHLPGFKYYDIITEEYQTGKSCGSKPCTNNCCQHSPCNNGTCTELCDGIRRFECKCPTGHLGRFCVKAMSCIDYMKNNMTSTSGEYTIFDISGSPLTVFCHMDSANMTAWTLVTSFSYGNNNQFKTFPLHEDFNLSDDNPNWSAYRLSLSWMLQLQTQSSLWKATCNYNLVSGNIEKDYMTARFGITDILVGESDMTNAKCTLVDSVNIRGYSCTNCTVRLIRSESQFTNVGVHDTELSGCGLVLDKKTTPTSEQAFGYYNEINNQFSCVESSSSTTQWWIGETLAEKRISINYVSVLVRSEGCDDVGITACGKAYIEVNGVDYATKVRGHNIVVLEPDGSILTASAFDTFGDPTSGQKMNQFLLDIPYGRVVLIAVMDSSDETLAGDAIEGLKWIGADINNSVGGYRESWLLIGYKGAKKSWVYQDGKPRFEGPTQISTTIPVTYFEY